MTTQASRVAPYAPFGVVLAIIDRWAPLLVLAGFVILPNAFSFEVKNESWQQGGTSFHVGVAGDTAVPAGQNWRDAFVAAMAAWTTPTSFTFSITSEDPRDPCVTNAGNGFGFALTNCGAAFGESTLAIENSRFSDGLMLHSGIVFDSNKTWSVYSGPWMGGTADFSRVAIHELGHTLGLDHEEDVPAIMSSVSDSDELPTSDDINGAQFHYGDNDADTIVNNLDNCRDASNQTQTDTDSDGAGDACDTDDDNDTVLDASDNCPLVANLGQNDLDNDGQGDACDDDDDNDGISDTPSVDQQQTTLNASTSGPIIGGSNRGQVAQTVTAGRAGFLTRVDLNLACLRGDLVIEVQGVNMAGTPDGVVLASHTVTNADAAFPFPITANFRTFAFANPVAFPVGGRFSIVARMVTNSMEQFDCIIRRGPIGESYDPGGDALFASDTNSGDWVAYKTFTDAENDFPFRTLVALDNCPITANPSQADMDSDGKGNDCDDDTDGDGMLNTVDADDDNDGVNDGADAFPLDPGETLDIDGDGTGNNADAFPNDPAETLDTDGDSLGNNADTDDDGDQLPDTYEIDNSFDPLNPADAALDTDGDGATNLQEFIAGTDPRDPNSKPAGSLFWLPLLLEEP